jgi:hypothetical protein
MDTLCDLWNIKFNEDKTQAIYFSYRVGPPEASLALNGWDIPVINHVKYLGVIFNKRITWKRHMEMIKAKAFRTYIRTYPLSKNESLSISIKLTLHKALIRSVMTNDLCLPCLGISGRHLPLKIAAPTKQGSPHRWKFSKMHTGP